MTWKNRLRASFLLGAVALVYGAPARGDTLFRDVRGWRVVMSSEYQGCVASAIYRDGTKVRFGVDGITGEFFINFSNRMWSAYPVSQMHEVGFEFDRRSPFRGYFKTVQREGMTTFENGEVARGFVDAFAGASNVTMSVNGAALTSFVLSGTRAAVSAVNECERYRR